VTIDTKIGVHLPHGVPGVTGATIIEWATTAEAAGFSSVGVAERLVYDSADAVVSLAAAAAVTERIGLLANIFVAPVRPPAVFAKEVATLSRFAPGRLTVGVAGGARPQDHAAAGVAWDQRGKLVDACLDALAALASPEDSPQSIGPVPDPSIEVLVGGASPGALRRLVRSGHGYVGGGIQPQFMAHEIAAVRRAWEEAGRDGEPRIVAGGWYASDDRYDDACDWLATYMLEGGPPEFVRATIARGRDGVLDSLEQHAAIGADEMIFFGCVDDVAELEWLADVVADRLATTG